MAAIGRDVAAATAAEELQCIAPRDRAQAAAPPADTPLARGVETVLLVEDETQVRALVARVLRGAGYTVLEASDGEEALRLSAAVAGRAIDVVVTDVVMPGLGGEDLAVRLRESHPGLKVLFVSGYTESGGALRSPLGEGMAFLEKPFTPRVLVHRIRELLDRPGSRAGAR